MNCESASYTGQNLSLLILDWFRKIHAAMYLSVYYLQNRTRCFSEMYCNEFMTNSVDTFAGRGILVT